MTVYIVPPDAWEKLEERLARIAEELVPEPRWAFRETDPLVSLTLGKWLAAASKIERRFVTLMGREAPRLVEPFLGKCTRLGGFWQLACSRPHAGSGYTHVTVKVVLSHLTLNSTMKRRVKEESRKIQNPIVLALIGPAQAQDLGAARFLSGPEAWAWITQAPAPQAYRKWLDTLYRVFMDTRRKLREEFRQAWREWLETMFT